MVALDLAILQKVLPKFNGTQQELQEPLEALLAFAITGKPASKGDAETGADDWDLVAGRLSRIQLGAGPAEAVFPRTAAKLWRMLRRLAGGFTSFVE